MTSRQRLPRQRLFESSSESARCPPWRWGRRPLDSSTVLCLSCQQATAHPHPQHFNASNKTRGARDAQTRPSDSAGHGSRPLVRATLFLCYSARSPPGPEGRQQDSQQGIKAGLTREPHTPGTTRVATDPRATARSPRSRHPRQRGEETSGTFSAVKNLRSRW